MAVLALRILDNLPVAMVKARQEEAVGEGMKAYDRGFPVGFTAASEVCYEARARGRSSKLTRHARVMQSPRSTCSVEPVACVSPPR